MAEYNLVCAYCSHGPHVAKPCAFGQCGCKVFLRPDVAVVRLVDMALSKLSGIEDQLMFQNAILSHTYPDAAAKAYALLTQQPQPQTNEEPIESDTANNNDASASIHGPGNDLGSVPAPQEPSVG